MSLARYEPWEALSNLHSQINRIFDTQYSNGTASSAATADWVPPADVESTASARRMSLARTSSAAASNARTGVFIAALPCRTRSTLQG
jgi:hypothetical protein